MASMESEDYLQDGFDPTKVTMPRLRSILVTHEVRFPSNAKKAQLVQYFNDNVQPLIPRLRAKRDKVQRSSLGIVNAGSAEDIPNWDEELAPPRSTRRSKSPRKSSARHPSVSVKSEVGEDTPVPKSVSKRQSRSVSRQFSTADEDDATPEAPKSVRRNNRRTVTPSIKAESEDEELPPPQEESFFSSENPFQSGSTPPRRKSSSHRRRTDDSVIKSGKSSRRTTEEYATELRAPTFASLEVPRAPRRSFTPEYSDEGDDFGAGEEFTPDAQLELEEAAKTGEAVLPSRNSPRNNGRSTGFKWPVLVLLLTLFGAYGAWYRQEKIAVGYCGLGRPAKELLPPEVQVPESLRPFVEPQCEKCPNHAYCYENFEARCEQDFVLQPHPLSVFGLVPLPPSCEPDSEKAAAVKMVADKAVEALRVRRAQFECGELVDQDGNLEDSPAIAEDELKSSVSSQRNKQRLNNEQFEDLWKAAIGEVTAMEEVEVTTKTSNSSGLPVRSLSSASLARVSLGCQARRSFKLGLGRLRVPIGLLSFLAMLFFYARARYRRHLKVSAQIPSLVDSVLGRLANQKELGDEEIEDPYLFLPNLRDDVLRTVHSVRERERIWQKVKAVVEQNSNVRTTQREGRNGEVGRAWEWVGPTGADAVAVRRRRSGRVSWGADVKPETPELERDQVKETKKWEEPRPIY